MSDVLPTKKDKIDHVNKIYSFLSRDYFVPCDILSQF